jgi:hypothetical protein
MGKPASSILVLLKYANREVDLNSILGDGDVLWSGQHGFEWIGKGDTEWDSAFLIRYGDRSVYQESIDKFKAENFQRIALYAVKPISALKRWSFRFLMKFIFPRFSVDFSDSDRNMNEIPESAILPTKEQHIRLASEDKGQPVVMVNLMEYYDHPPYPIEYEGERSRTGEDAYNQYGKSAMKAVANLGGLVENVGDVEAILIGESDEKWNQFGLMQYPSRELLKSMFRIRESPEAAIQRDAGLKATRVYAFTPV